MAPSSQPDNPRQNVSRAPVHSQGPRPTAPEFVFDQPQASARTINSRQASHISEPTLGHAQNHTPNSVQTLSRGSGTTFIPPGSSPYLNAVDSEQFDILTDMELDTRVISSPKPPKRKRKSLSPDSRDRAAKMRKLKACIRCRLLHEQCGDGDPCPSCRNIQGTAIVWNMDCFRASVKEVQVYRTAAISFPDGFPTITKWVDKSNHVVQLYNSGLTDAHLKPLERPIFTVKCHQYIDEIPVNYLKRCWTSDGEKKEIVLPKFAIRNLQRTKVSEKLDTTFNTNYTKLLGELSFKQDEIVSTTLTAAAWFAQNGEKRENRDMVHSALRIAIITRLISKSFNITGSESFGIPQDTDPTSPYFQRIPIPPILDFQIDCAWMHKMDKFRKAVVSRLMKLIMKHERENWYTIFLTIMVLLSNLEFIYQHQHRQMLRYCRPDYNPSEMMESWQHSAKILITYFHAISHGNLPIVMKWTKEDEEAAGLDKQARAYLAQLKGLVESQDELLRERAKGQPYTPLVWLSTLLLKNDGGIAGHREIRTC